MALNASGKVASEKKRIPASPFCSVAAQFGAGSGFSP